MKTLIHTGEGECRWAIIGAQGVQEIVIRRDLTFNFGDVVEVRITAFHPTLHGYFAEAAGKSLFIPTSIPLTEGQTVRVQIVKEARPDKEATAHLCEETNQEAIPSGEAISAVEMDALIAEAMAADVPIGDGALLHIGKTRVAWTIDVDSGKSRQPLASVNKAAVSEIGRQIGLKNMGGLILIDFAGTKRGAVRKNLEPALVTALKEDDLVAGQAWTKAGLYEIERKRTRADLWYTCGADNPIAAYYRVRHAIAAHSSGNPKVHVAPAVMGLLKQQGVRARLFPVFDKPVDYFEIEEA